MNFGEAIEALKSGKRTTRAGWNGKGMFLFLIRGGIMTRPYIAIKDAQGKTVPWLASQTDMLSEDWEIVK